MARAVRGETLHLLAAGADFTVTIVNWLDPRSDERWGRRTGTSRSSTTRPSV